MLITRVFYSDYIGPARLRLNLPEVAPELKRVWHPCTKGSSAPTRNTFRAAVQVLIKSGRMRLSCLLVKLKYLRVLRRTSILAKNKLKQLFVFVVGYIFVRLTFLHFLYL